MSYQQRDFWRSWRGKAVFYGVLGFVAFVLSVIIHLLLGVEL